MLLLLLINILLHIAFLHKPYKDKSLFDIKKETKQTSKKDSILIYLLKEWKTGQMDLHGFVTFF